MPAADEPAPSAEHGAPSCRHPRWLALLVTLAYLVPALVTLGDYGPTWDHVKGDYPYGERLLGYLETHDPRFLELKALKPEPKVREPHPDFAVGRYPSHWIWPVAPLLSAISCRVLWTQLELVPAMAAHHLPAPLTTAVLVFALTAFAARRFGTLAAIVSGGSLVAAPVFFGHAANNLKDAPECCFYTLAVLAGLVALENPKPRRWIVAGVLVGLALQQKPNALFLPFQLALFLALSFVAARRVGERSLALRPRDVGWAALGFLVTYYAVSPSFWSEPIEGPRRVIAQMLAVGHYSLAPTIVERPDTVSFEGPLAVLWSTPPITMALALLGMLWTKPPRHLRIFLVLGLLLPIARTLIPGIRNFNGVRHFIEFMPMLALLAGLGAAALAQALRRRLAPPPVGAHALTAGVALIALLPPVVQTIDTHPNQITYFNGLVGGLAGARERRLPEACDFWGNSYWQGLAWVSAHAEPNATLIVPFPGFIAEAAVPVRLRPDIHFWTDRRRGDGTFPMYVMTLVNRNSSPFARHIDEVSQPVLEIRSQGAAILRVHRLEGESGAAEYARWLDERANRARRKRVRAYIGTHPEVVEAIRALPLETRSTLDGLRPLFPPELQGDLEATWEGLFESDEDEEP